jgi:hypothetical protein
MRRKRKGAIFRISSEQSISFCSRLLRAYGRAAGPAVVNKTPKKKPAATREGGGSRFSKMTDKAIRNTDRL